MTRAVMTRAAMTQMTQIFINCIKLRLINMLQCSTASRLVFLYVDVNVKVKGQAEICTLNWNAFCGWLEGVGVGPWAA